MTHTSHGKVDPAEQQARAEWTGPVSHNDLHCSECGAVLTNENLAIHQACTRRLLETLGVAPLLDPLDRDARR